MVEGRKMVQSHGGVWWGVKLSGGEGGGAGALRGKRGGVCGRRGRLAGGL